MKKFVIAALLASASTAQAADVAPSAWDGAYIGGGIGSVAMYAEATSIYGYATSEAGEYGRGFSAALATGTNASFHRAIFGLEADFAYANLTASQYYHTARGLAGVDSTFRGLTSLRGRVGYAFGTGTLLYGTSGFALGRFEQHLSGPTNASTSKLALGYVAGIGVEHRLNASWSLKGEYVFAGFEKAYGDARVTNIVGFLRFGANMKL